MAERKQNDGHELVFTPERDKPSGIFLSGYRSFPHFRSIRFNLWMTFVAMTIVMLAITWVYELIFYSTLYVSFQENDLLKLGREFSVTYVEMATAHQPIERFVTDYASQNNVNIVVFSDTEEDVTDINVKYSATPNTGVVAGGIEGKLLTLYMEKLEPLDYNYSFATNTLDNNSILSDIVFFGMKTVIAEETEYIYLSVTLPSFGQAQNTLVGQLAVITFVCLVIALVIAYFGAGVASRPLRKLSLGVLKQSQGGKREPLDTNTGLAEIDELSVAFNKAFDEVEVSSHFRRDLLANVSHDMKTPLTMIRAYAEMIRDISGGNKEKCARQAQIISDETVRLSSLINEVIALSKLESGADKLYESVIDISEKLSATIDRFGIMEETKGYNFITDIVPDLLVRADGDKIDRVVYNLVGNAMNYTGEDKTVKVVCHAVGEVARVEVSDTGKGMTEEELASVWEKYYRLAQDKRNVVGSGLGLSIVKSILELHGVRYGVNSEKDKGSTFWFELPLVK